MKNNQIYFFFFYRKIVPVTLTPLLQTEATLVLGPQCGLPCVSPWFPPQFYRSSLKPWATPCSRSTSITPQPLNNINRARGAGPQSGTTAWHESFCIPLHLTGLHRRLFEEPSCISHHTFEVTTTTWLSIFSLNSVILCERIETILSMHTNSFHNMSIHLNRSSANWEILPNHRPYLLKSLPAKIRHPISGQLLQYSHWNMFSVTNKPQELSEASSK